MIWYQYIFLVLAVVCYSFSQLHTFQKLKWQKRTGFWGFNSWDNKYKQDSNDDEFGTVTLAPDNWYYRLIGVTFKERWFTSTWLTVSLTDGYHALQFIMKICFALGIFGITWKAGIAWICWTCLQWGCFKMFSRT